MFAHWIRVSMNRGPMINIKYNERFAIIICQYISIRRACERWDMVSVLPVAFLAACVCVCALHKCVPLSTCHFRLLYCIWHIGTMIIVPCNMYTTNMNDFQQILRSFNVRIWWQYITLDGHARDPIHHSNNTLHVRFSVWLGVWAPQMLFLSIYHSHMKHIVRATQEMDSSFSLFSPGEKKLFLLSEWQWNNA